MPDDTDNACPPDAENNTADAPAPRPAALQHDKSDIGCMIALGGLLVCVFLLPAAIWFGGIYVAAVLFVFLLALATPWINPVERMSPGAKWAGRVVTFLFLVALVVGAYLLFQRYFPERFVDETQPG